MAISTAILVFDGVQIIDYTGPYEALGRRGPTYLVAGPDTAREVWIAAAEQPAADLVDRIDATWEDLGWARTPDGDGRTVAIGRADDGSQWQVAVGVEPMEPGSGGDAGARHRVTVEVVRMSSAT